MMALPGWQGSRWMLGASLGERTMASAPVAT
jgi:hypothetical protein